MESRVAEQKKQLRGELLRLRRETPRQQKQAIDRQICQHVINSPEYRQAQTIFAYWSPDEEIATPAILADARQRAPRVSEPKCWKGPRSHLACRSRESSVRKSRRKKLTCVWCLRSPAMRPASDWDTAADFMTDFSRRQLPAAWCCARRNDFCSRFPQNSTICTATAW